MEKKYRKKGLISVIIPMYNSEEYIFGTLKSLQQQTYCEFEAIIIDDGSTDKCGEIADRFAAEDDRFIVKHIKNGGVSKARNLGISGACGEWLYCLDSDDIMDKHMLEIMITKSDNAQMVISSIVIEKENENPKIVRNQDAVFENRDEISDYLVNMKPNEKDLLLNYLWNRLMKMDIIIRNQITFDENVSLGEDFLFICKYLEKCNKIVLLDSPLYHYYIRGKESLTGKFSKNEHQRRILMRQALKDLLTSFEVFQKAYDTYSTNEGRYTIYGIEKLNLDNCTLSWNEKMDYINSFLGKEDIGLIECYLKKSSGKNIVIWHCLIKLKSKTLIYLYLKLKKLHQIDK